ncbi:hypothetical protein OQA88_7935 [Cercophora sp. LCS_1]
MYYTQFTGNAISPPTIKGCDKFKGIALFDTDPYIPGGSGAEWYINQNQFFRQVRNFVFDLTEMPQSTADNDQPLVPTGIHWRISQATSLQNLVFNMPRSGGASAANATTAVGIFTEKGSGGFVSDLTFNGGNICWRAGSQQFTARNLKFNNCLTAVQMIWDWGWTWQGIEITGGAVGFNISGAGGSAGQGVGSASIVDSIIKDVPIGILTNNKATAPNIVLDNTKFTNVARVVQEDGGNVASGAATSPASLMFRITKQASGYFENVWAWVADHDSDASIFGPPDSSSTHISLFCARGMLIESHGASWFYGSRSEHSVMYNYQLNGAKNVYMGHIQTESPYFQPVPGAPAPFGAAKRFPKDPEFGKCNVTADSDSERCRYAWGLRIVDSADVTIHSAGLYSFFNDYYQDCIATQNCQDKIPEVRGSTGIVIFNLFTVATINMATGIDRTRILQADGNQRGFTTEVSVWVPLLGNDNLNIVYLGPEVFGRPSVSCSAPCLLVFPTSPLGSPSTVEPGDFVASLE